MSKITIRGWHVAVLMIAVFFTAMVIHQLRHEPTLPQCRLDYMVGDHEMAVEILDSDGYRIGYGVQKCR